MVIESVVIEYVYKQTIGKQTIDASSESSQIGAMKAQKRGHGEIERSFGSTAAT
ncbi:MAG: hypothetical protein F6K00_04220 [Leptolyngbya sp. SIOISBB]|nr:hypothetical protein [Leptolyngbya sp. SIOISBB]